MRKWGIVPVKVQAPRFNGFISLVMHPVGKTILAVLVFTITACLAVFAFYYFKYSRLIEEKLAAGPFANTSMLFASPRVVTLGDVANFQDIVSDLRRAGYTESQNNRIGHFTSKPEEVAIYPGPDSRFQPDAGVIKFAGTKVSKIISLGDNTDRTEYTLEPELISNLFDKHREKRRIVRYEDIPPLLVHAVVAVEDKRFFEHRGFDPRRILKAVYVDMREHRYAQGASTLSQQLARQFWLDNDKTWRRKIPELLITLHLEQKLSKEKIFEYYANQVPLGQRGSFGIRGFGEAAQVFFGKDLSRLTLPEAATIAGLIQLPSFTNPFRWPDRAKQRRNIVLRAMRDNKYITDEQYETAAASPMSVSRHGTESTDAPYFVDLVNDTLVDKFSQHDFQSSTYRIYTTIDLQLQHDASEAVRIGMEEVDKALKAHRKKNQPPGPEAQCALIALDPQTGEVLALIGGRNYGASQLDRAQAKRQPGSSFKPFVYATALNTGLLGGSTILTAATIINDEPTTFWFDGKPYTPGNFHGELLGLVSMRQAIAHSLNIPTVKLAEQTGYRAVVETARRAGMNLNIHPTPAVALGAYEVTPLEIAGAYTVFANRGMFTEPYFISSIRGKNGESIFEGKSEHKQALDPRVAFLMDSLLEEVLRSGTGAGVHARGINFPAAGKTGTSRDGWFAGFTSRLICVVWVGFDDNRELNLEGAKSALPVWAEFMRRAHEHRKYRNVTDFTAPAGIGSAQIDPTTGQLATTACPTVRTEYFIEGTQPVETCSLHGGGGARVAGWEPMQQEPGEDGGKPVLQANLPPAHPNAPQSPSAVQSPNAQTDPQKKKGIFGKLKDIFK